MKNLSKLAFIFLFICLIISCSQNNKNTKNINSETPENLYALAMQDLEKENYENNKNYSHSYHADRRTTMVVRTD